MRIAVSGTRDLLSTDILVIQNRMKEIVSEYPEKLVFGGARGADTIALAAAGTARAGIRVPQIEVIVPRHLRDQPPEAQKAVSRYADEVIELGAPRLDVSAYRRRNREMVARADHLVAFWDGRSGGTGMTVDLAHKARISVEIVQIQGS